MAAVVSITQQDPFVALADEWVEAKAREARANRERIAIEERIVELAQPGPEGRTTIELADGRKVIVTSKVTRTVDGELWLGLRDRVPEHLRPIREEVAFKIDTKGLHWLQEHDAATYGVVAMAITAKPAKPAVEVKV